MLQGSHQTSATNFENLNKVNKYYTQKFNMEPQNDGCQ